MPLPDPVRRERSASSLRYGEFLGAVRVKQRQVSYNEVYAQALPLADKLYLTVVDDSPAADTYFPDYSAFKNIKVTGSGQKGQLKYRLLELS